MNPSFIVQHIAILEHSIRATDNAWFLAVQSGDLTTAADKQVLKKVMEAALHDLKERLVNEKMQLTAQ